MDPYVDTHQWILQNLMKTFCNLMEIISTENKKIFLEGDFNIDLMKVESDNGIIVWIL